MALREIREISSQSSKTRYYHDQYECERHSAWLALLQCLLSDALRSLNQTGVETNISCARCAALYFRSSANEERSATAKHLTNDQDSFCEQYALAEIEYLYKYCEKVILFIIEF